MNALPAPLTAFFFCLLRISLQADILILLVLVAQWLFRNQLSPKWRYALWLLVVLRLALPWSLPNPVSAVGFFQHHPLVAPGIASNSATTRPDHTGAYKQSVPPGGGDAMVSLATQTATTAFAWLEFRQNWLFGAWLLGAVALLARLLASGIRMRWGTRRKRPLTDAVVLDLLEDCKQDMRIYTPLAIIETDTATSPALYGFIRPRLLLPAGLRKAFSISELRHVFLHELGHIKRGDIPVNWLATLLLILNWFNPLVWYAFHRMQADRELACDALALSYSGDQERQAYGRTVIKALELFSLSAVSPGMAGILENRNQMKARIRMIRQFNKSDDWPVAAVALFISLALVGFTGTQSSAGAAPKTADLHNSVPRAPAAARGRPTVVSTSPQVGAMDVDPAITRITVTFSRDMERGFSWTGGGPDFPPSPAGQRPYWINKRTCILPVKLQAAHYYRVGINSDGYRNFRGVDGAAVRPTAIYFTTRGAGRRLQRMAAKPVIVALVPKNGARNVNPNLAEIRVTFSVPMAAGFSWTGGGPDFPTVPNGRRPYWNQNHETCVLPVKLEPGHTYRLGLNSRSYKNFQSSGGVPLVPVLWSFTTRKR